MLFSLMLINGMSLLLIFIMESLMFGPILMGQLFSLLIIFSFPHFIITYWIWIKRVEDWRQEWWPLLFPVLYASFYLIVWWLKLSWIDISILVKLSYCYLLYHFSQQLYGANLWLNYSYRINYAFREKQIFRGFCLLTALYALMMMEMSGATSGLFYHEAVVWHFAPKLISFVFYLVMALFVVLLLMRLRYFWIEKNVKELYPFLGYLVCFIWFFPPSLYVIALFLPIIHALQYLPFVWMKLKKHSRFQLVSLSLGSVVAGYILFRWLPFQNFHESLPASIWAPLILTTLNNHHFVIDGRIWKLRDPQNKDLLIK